VTSIAERRVSANGVDFAYLECGEGPLALCLHGFPDSAWTWRDLLPALAGAGFRAVAPFTRGYAPTSVPADGRYQIAALAQDAIALHEVLGGDGDAVLIGHDWGATSTYAAASGAPERWRRIVAMAVPPGEAFLAAVMTDIDQLKRIWYMFFFQHPFADLIVPAGDLAFIDRLWADWSPGYDASADLPFVKAALRGPAHLTAAIGYYRAALGGVGLDPALDDLQAKATAFPPQPTLYLHGAQDGCIGVEVAHTAAAQAPAHVRTEIVEGAGHFMNRERPDEVADLVIAHLTS
jgi:pimeloyl-ACP methyl ester carboxylesterase